MHGLRTIVLQNQIAEEDAKAAKLAEDRKATYLAARKDGLSATQAAIVSGTYGTK